MNNIKKSNSCSNKQTGFTLIELMIVVAIIGVISAIAFPSYNSYMKKARRTDAKVALTKMADAQERYYLQNSTYTTSVTDIGGANSEEGHYTLSAAAGANGLLNGFVLSAVADSDGAQVTDTKCKTFMLTSTGVKSSKDSSDATSTKCW